MTRSGDADAPATVRRAPRTSARKDCVDEAESLGGRGVDRVAGQQQLQSFARRELTRHLIRGDRRKNAEVDLGLAELRAVGGEDEVAGERQLAAAAERGAAHERDRDDVEPREDAEAVVKVRSIRPTRSPT